MGFRINFSKSGVGYSWGVKGFRKTYTADGRERTTYSIPGTGISYVEESKKQPSPGNRLTSSNEYRTEKNESNMNIIFSGFKIVAIVVSLSILFLIVLAIIGNNRSEISSDRTNVAMVDDGNENLDLVIDGTSTHQYSAKLSSYIPDSDKEETYKNSVSLNYSDDTAFVDSGISTTDNSDRIVQNDFVPIAKYSTGDEIDSDTGLKVVTYTLLTEEEQLVLDEINMLISSGNTADAYASLLKLGDSVDERI